MALGSDVAAINELLTSLEEESISELVLKDGSVTLTLVTENLGAVPLTLLVEDPKAYPNSPVVVMSSSDVDLPFLEQITAKLAAGGRLTKAVRLLGTNLGMDLDWVEEADGEGCAGSDHDEDMVDADQHSDEEDAELLREWSRCLTRWEAVERQQEKQAKEEEKDGSVSAGNLDALSNKQIFDIKAAFRRLVNEMEEIFKAEDFNMAAEANGPDGLYTWNVSLAGFSPDSQLAQDMQQAGRKFGVSSVQLQLVFKRGLHPFYPPSIKLMAPRFQGPMLNALASHPMFSPERWDPMSSAKDVLLSIKSFLEGHGRVDLGAERNRMTGGPGASAYLDTEHLLARLEALSESSSVWHDENHPLYSEHNASGEKSDKSSSPLPAPKKQKAEGAEARVAGARGQAGGIARVAWAAGTGYGFGHKQGAEVWDAKRAAAVQTARDAELREVLFHLAKALTAQLGGAQGRLVDGTDVADCVLAVRKGCLAPLLVHQLRAASFQDMASRHAYYLALLECVEAVCNPLTSAMLSWRAADGEPTIADTVERLKLQVSHFVKVFNGAGSSGSTGGGAAASASSGAGRRAAPTTQAAHAVAASTAAAPSQEEEQREVGLANYLMQVAEKVADKVLKVGGPKEQGPSTSAAATAAAAGGSRTRQQAAAAAAAAAAAPGLEADELYRSQMSAHKVRILSGISATHAFRTVSTAEGVQPKERLRRVGKELASCESDLPIHPDSSVFVVADEASTCLWKALIVGPKGTPYEGGCFLFDIYFPTDYPRAPPKVQLKTTGAGSVRFNPNLYNCGKVCLSLLGTWQGAKGESWDPQVSTILQVLVSIQSLIMVDQPFYNEPGYEQSANSAQSDAYSANIMEQTVRWAMLDQLRGVPPYFADVIRGHFKLRGDAVLATCRRWAAWCKEKGHARHATAIETMTGQLEEECRKLNRQARW